ncbi:uncharacterized protein LOC110030662 [Phalaenopsis equestris]|uniref:uncharacterized protein LOC110030662 n=1 Tax=Phalaenopsis equestris TaxID=78828 RepID=UPI0009E27C2F|nr:uncharacterized protein LOC110030662 [Phalaenopsis equestris]
MELCRNPHWLGVCSLLELRSLFPFLSFRGIRPQVSHMRPLHPARIHWASNHRDQELMGHIQGPKLIRVQALEPALARHSQLHRRRVVQLRKLRRGGGWQRQSLQT